jgi:hypothetical protein
VHVDVHDVIPDHIDMNPNMNLNNELIPATENLTPMVRSFISSKLNNLLDSLDPYIDGTMGPVSSRHVSNYVNALKLLGALYRVYDPVPAPVPVEDPDEYQILQTSAMLRDQVLAQLEQLAIRTGSGVQQEP